MYDDQQNSLLAKNLKGNLFIAYGGIDDNVCNILGVVAALIQNNKDFDMIVPNTFHNIFRTNYMIGKKVVLLC